MVSNDLAWSSLYRTKSETKLDLVKGIFNKYRKILAKKW